MSDLIVTIDVEADVDQDGNFYEIMSFKGAFEGLAKLALFMKLVDIELKYTFFVSPLFKDFSLLEEFGDSVEIGVLFSPGDFDPGKEPLERSKHVQKSFDIERKTLKEKLVSCIKLYEDIKPTSIRFGGAAVNSDILEWLGENEFGLTHSSSTAPGLLSVDKEIDHRLYKHDPYRLGNVIEVPFSIYGEDRVGWVSPVMGFGLTDNVFEIMRKAPVVNINFSLRDLVVGCSVFIKDEEDVTILMDRLAAWLWFAKRGNMCPKLVSEIEPISEGF